MIFDILILKITEIYKVIRNIWKVFIVLTFITSFNHASTLSYPPPSLLEHWSN